MLRQRESRYSFNYEIYREWNSGNAVWLDEEEGGNDDDSDGPGDDGGPGSESESDCVCSFAATLQPVCSSVLQSKKEEEDVSFTECFADDGDLHSAISSLRKNTGAQEADRKDLSLSCCVCAPGSAAKIDQKRPDILKNEKACGYNDSLVCGDLLQTAANYCELRKAASVRGSTLPLPGVLDHRDFERVNKDLGRCDLCGKGKAVFSSKELKMSVCEGCFGRILKEDLRGGGEMIKT